VQGNCQDKNFLIPKASQTKKEKEPGGERTGVTTTDTPKVAKSPTQLTDISMGITVGYLELGKELIRSCTVLLFCHCVMNAQYEMSN
jgi:hypothetical protein